MSDGRGLPFSAVVGQEEAKLALLLAAVEPSIGGVLLRGDKGSAKTTLARGLAALLPGGAPFVELPIGASEDRVVGTLDLTAALTGGEVRFSPGLLASADGGVLYVDEINLLPDHLVDVLLDVAASGVNRVEREGISHIHPSRFLLIGSMNPEEGELRPQLLDRFGLAVAVHTPVDPGERAAAVRRRLEFDASPSGVASLFGAEEAELARRLASGRAAAVPDELVEGVSALCASVGAEGLRADLTICRAAAALAGWEERSEAEPEDVRRVAALALAHRARRQPFDPVGADEDRLREALDEHVGGSPDGGADEGGSPDRGADDGSSPPAEDAPPITPGAARAAPLGASRARRSEGALGRRGSAEGATGRLVGDRPAGPGGPLAVGATVRRAAARVAVSGPPGAGQALVEGADLREAVREHKTANLVVIAVDASGSMGAEQRMAAAKGAVVGLLVDAYQRRDLVALVAFRGDGAEVLLRPTGSVEVARARLVELPTGGRTPLAAGIRAALDIATAPARLATHRPSLVLITDGRATAAAAGADPVDAAEAAADAVRRSGVEAVVIDVESAGSNGPRLGLARDLAERMGARHLAVDELTAQVVEGVVRPGRPV